MFLEWRTAFLHISPRFQYSLINTSVKGDSLSPLTIPLRRAEPARPQLPAARILQPLSISPNIPAIHPAEIVHLPNKMPVLLPAP